MKAYFYHSDLLKGGDARITYRFIENEHYTKPSEEAVSEKCVVKIEQIFGMLV